MNEIKMLADHRPEIEPLTDDERRQLWATMSGDMMNLGDRVDDVGLDLAAVEPIYLAEHRRSDRRRHLTMAAAAVVAVLGVGGLVAINGRSGGTPTPAAAPVASSGPAAAPAVTPVILVPESLSTVGLRLPHPGVSLIRDTPSGFQRRVFGAADDPGDPTRMIHVEYGTGGSFAEVSCQDMVPFDVAGTTGNTASSAGVLTAGWTVEGVNFELTPVRQSPVSSSSSSVGRCGPCRQRILAARRLIWLWTRFPAGGRCWSARTSPTHNGSSRAPGWRHRAEPTTIRRQLVVHTWTGVDAQGVYAKQPPIGANRITIRGHDGYVFQSDQTGANGPQQLDIWWTEQPGMVVWVSTSDLYALDQLIDIIENMVPLDEASFAAFSADSSNY